MQFGKDSLLCKFGESFLASHAPKHIRFRVRFLYTGVGGWEKILQLTLQAKCFSVAKITSHVDTCS